MRSTLTRLAILFGVSLMLFVSSGSGVALAGNGCNHATNPAQCQYTEVVPIIHHRRHSGGATRRHTSTNPTTSHKTTTTRGGKTSTVRGITAGRHRHHKTRRHKTSHNRPVHRGSTGGRRVRAINSKPARGTTGLPAAAATGSGGGIGIWLPVILGLVLVGGSAAGILRYRHTR